MLIGKVVIAALFFTFLASGCSTTQSVMLAKARPTSKVLTVARVPDDGNSPEMDANLESAIVANGMQLKAPLPTGTRTYPNLDATISYVDVWRWDIAMYLQSITVRMFDAKSGDLLVTGQWNDSPLHGFRDAKHVVNGLIEEMLSKLRAATQQ